MYFIMFTDRRQMYKRFIHFSHRSERVSLGKERFRMAFRGCVYSEKQKDFRLNRVTLVVDQNHRVDLPQRLQKRKRYTKAYCEIPLESIVSRETWINNPLHVEVDMDGEILEFNVGHKSRDKKPGKFRYVPVTSVYYRDKALFIRGNIHQNYTLVVRDKDPAE